MHSVRLLLLLSAAVAASLAQTPCADDEYAAGGQCMHASICNTICSSGRTPQGEQCACGDSSCSVGGCARRLRELLPLKAEQRKRERERERTKPLFDAHFFSSSLLSLSLSLTHTHTHTHTYTHTSVPPQARRRTHQARLAASASADRWIQRPRLHHYCFSRLSDLALFRTFFFQVCDVAGDGSSFCTLCANSAYLFSGGACAVPVGKEGAMASSHSLPSLAGVLSLSCLCSHTHIHIHKNTHTHTHAHTHILASTYLSLAFCFRSVHPSFRPPLCHQPFFPSALCPQPFRLRLDDRCGFKKSRSPSLCLSVARPSSPTI